MTVKPAVLTSLFCLQCALAQWYFPDQDIKLGSAPSIAPSGFQSALATNISELRGTAFYERYVDAIIANGISQMTLAIDKSLENNMDNVVFAPVSIAAVLALLMMGSSGSSFLELSNVMGLATGVDMESRSQLVHEQFGRIVRKIQETSGFQMGSEVSFATSIFVQDSYPIRDIYKTTAQSIYQSEVLNLNFRDDPVSAQQVINTWVSDRTNGKIKNILAAPPSVYTKVILASAMYFKAEWEYPFFEGGTKSRPWYTNGKSAKSDVMADFMSNGEDFPYYKDNLLDVEVIGFPYKGNRTTMYVLKPVDSDKNKLHQLASRLTAADVERLVGNVRITGCLVLFPRMKIDSTIDLTNSLKQLGVQSVFDPARANLALLSPATRDRGDGATVDDAPYRASLPEASEAFAKAPVPVPHQSSGSVPKDSDGQEVLIFSRMRDPANCSLILDNNSGLERCEDVIDVNGTGTQKVVYKKFGDKVGRRLVKRRIMPRAFETLDTLRQRLDSDPNGHLENPGLYVDQVVHKVYMDITESGTEAAAATLTSLSRDGGRVVFRADTPFLFFIRHEETKIIFFWGAVNTPTPHTPHPAS